MDALLALSFLVTVLGLLGAQAMFVGIETRDGFDDEDPCPSQS